MNQEPLYPTPVQNAAANSTAKRTPQPILWGCGGLFLALIIFVGGMGIGFGMGRLDQRTPAAAGASLISTLTGDERVDSERELAPAFDTFWEALDLLYTDFYGELPADEAATYGAIRGVVNLLDDPNTSFLTPDEAEFFRTSMRGNFEGIGARVQWDEDFDTLIVTEPFENQPAWNAGIRRNDLIIAVDGESIVGTDLNDAVARIRGPKGSTVLLTVVREGEIEPFDVEVTRDLIETPTISTDSLGENGEIAYVRLNTFNENSGQLVRQAVEDAVQRDAAGLIFDLRGNSGGLLREAIKISSLFLESGEDVLIERFSDGTEQVYDTEGRSVTDELPMIVLVNGGSASASEIVAGALQDADRADLIGTTTYGKGSVQLPHTLSDGSIMRVTIARWYTPDDRSIDGTGLEPDITVELSEDELTAGDDPQLDAALERLETLLNQE